jgi:hypothetical protein
MAALSRACAISPPASRAEVLAPNGPSVFASGVYPLGVPACAEDGQGYYFPVL